MSCGLLDQMAAGHGQQVVVAQRLAVALLAQQLAQRPRAAERLLQVLPARALAQDLAHHLPKRGRSKLPRWPNTVLRLVPAHLQRASSSDTAKDMSVSGPAHAQLVKQAQQVGVGVGVEDQEAGVHAGLHL